MVFPGTCEKTRSQKTSFAVGVAGSEIRLCDVVELRGLQYVIPKIGFYRRY
jgi:hypothetical protein